MNCEINKQHHHQNFNLSAWEFLMKLLAHSQGKVEHKFNYADAIFLIFNNTENFSEQREKTWSQLYVEETSTWLARRKACSSIEKIIFDIHRMLFSKLFTTFSFPGFLRMISSKISIKKLLSKSIILCKKEIFWEFYSHLVWSLNCITSNRDKF